MAGILLRKLRAEAAGAGLSGERARTALFWPLTFLKWREDRDLILVEEFRDDGALVVRADLPGIDPGKDVEVTLSGGKLQIEAERRAREGREEQGYVRQELRYGPLSRSLPLPEGVTSADITATYTHGVLEIRIPEPRHALARKITVART